MAALGLECDCEIPDWTLLELETSPGDGVTPQIHCGHDAAITLCQESALWDSD